MPQGMLEAVVRGFLVDEELFELGQLRLIQLGALEATTAAGAAFNRRLLPVSTGTPEPCVEDPLSDPDSLSDAGVGKAFGPQFEGTNTAILLRLRRDLAGSTFSIEIFSRSLIYKGIIP